MQQILYKSEASKGTSSSEVFRIISTSSRNNAGRGITGFLIYAQDRFLQLIEGEAAALDTLLSDLEDDPRHHNLSILQRKEIAERSFPRWSMERIAVATQDVDALIERLQSHGIGRTACDQVRDFFEPVRALG